MSDARTPVFEAVRAICPEGVFNKTENIYALHNLLDAFGAKRETQAQRKLADEPAFYKGVREVTKTISIAQLQTIKDLLTAATHWPIGWVAYGLATAWHEARFTPTEEWGHGKGRAYAKAGKYGQPQYGRGLVQLTWDKNYEWADDECAKAGLIKEGEILADFSLVLRPDIATFILVRGMETGAFTTKKLADYLGEAGTPESFKNARRIINGTDKDVMIAGYAMIFQEALRAGKWA